ncbi:hypothetical protein [Flavobacterium sp. WV_118_3]|uniref:hypothetical protein n=1 Tax=Flavobacterium sp. WV_118_3 TaxID=3151764 RepID=UPI00321B32E9
MENNTENTESKDNNSTLLIELLKSINVNALVETITNFFDKKADREARSQIEREKIGETLEVEKLKAQNEFNKLNLQFTTRKFWKEVIILIIIMGSVLLLSYYDKIDNCTLGTLFGSIIGYTIGNFNSNNFRG